ncbi:hypothetical protein F8M41_004663 [Gigaspora margarita]|uniref:Uncharacterized protein n=1 Tax=Gigaspora margarita TaxID=4874 RepID=A0A8H3XAW1_GIGMA|nr:hypothetical protein F8M41_004663 [Gigaspora margarita]
MSYPYSQQKQNANSEWYKYQKNNTDSQQTSDNKKMSNLYSYQKQNVDNEWYKYQQNNTDNQQTSDNKKMSNPYSNQKQNVNNEWYKYQQNNANSQQTSDHKKMSSYQSKNKNNESYKYQQYSGWHSYQQKYDNNEWDQYQQSNENSGLYTYSQQNKSNNRIQQQIQKQETVTAYDRQVTYEIFYDSMEFLEKYIEIAGYFPDWNKRKQFPNNEVKRSIDGPEDAEECFSIVLLGLKNTIKRKPLFIQEEIKKEFYRWISSTGINENNCPERLQHILFGFSEILDGRSEKFDKDLKNSKQTLDQNSPEYARELSKTFASFQAPLQNQRKIAESLEGKKHDDIDIKNKFDGNIEQGQGILHKIGNTVSNVHESFYFFPQEDRKEHIANNQLLKTQQTESDIEMIL